MEEGKEYLLNFDRFIGAAFPDLDIELLFEPSLDGIEDTDVAEVMGMFLKPAEWFDEAYGPVHPYILVGSRGAVELGPFGFLISVLDWAGRVRMGGQGVQN